MGDLAWKRALDDAYEREDRMREKSFEQASKIGTQACMLRYAQAILEDAVETEDLDEGLRLRAVSWLRVLDNAKQEGEL